MDWSVGLTVWFWSHRSSLVCSGPSCSVQFGLVCSGWGVLVCTALVFSLLCPPGRFWSGFILHVSSVVLDPISSDLFCSSLVYPSSVAGLLRLRLISLGFVLSDSFWPVLVWSIALCSRLVYSCNFMLVTLARIWIGLVSFGLSCLFCSRALSCLFWSVLVGPVRS